MERVRNRIRKWLFPELWELRELYYALQVGAKHHYTEEELRDKAFIVLVGSVRESTIRTGNFSVTGGTVANCYIP